MPSRPLVTPVGFTPEEISALINQTVISQHAEEAAFLWTMRNRAIEEPQYTLVDLMTLDRRVEAHHQGLRVAGDAGWEACCANLDVAGPGEIFALGILAFGAGHRERMTQTLRLASSAPRGNQGLISALGWLPFQQVAEWIEKLLHARSPLHRALGVRASAVHRRDIGPHLVAAVLDADATLRNCGLRAVGELKRRDLTDAVYAQLRNESEWTRLWAAWALALIGDPEGPLHLTQWFESSDALGVRARQTGLRALGVAEGRAWIRTLASRPELARESVMAAGIVGDPALIPWLIEMMAVPELARLAGEAFTMITGMDLVYRDLDREPPSSEDVADGPIEAILDLDYESNLPWPSLERITAWWTENKSQFTPGVRHLDGRPIARSAALETLATGKQRLRAAAALELALLDPAEILFEVRARGDWQQHARGL